VRRQVRLVDAIARHVVFPSVIDTSNAAFLVASKEQRRAAVWATMIHNAGPAGTVAKRDQLLPEQHQADRRRIGHKFRAESSLKPILPH
jgi:hypothetical protein